MSTGEWVLFGVIMLACLAAWFAGRPLDREWKRLKEANRVVDSIERNVLRRGNKREGDMYGKRNGRSS